MTTIRLLATAIMSAGFGFFGLAKIARLSAVTGSDSWPRLAEPVWAAIGTAEVVAVAALLLALHPRFRTVGLAAASGLAVLALCAVVFHVNHGDPVGDIAPAIAQGGVAALYVAVGLRARRRSGDTIAADAATAEEPARPVLAAAR
ncbi:MAG: DoxX family protein [Actinomycetota bacterium]